MGKPHERVAVRRRLQDQRLLAASGVCPDDGKWLVPTGDAYGQGVEPEHDDWYVAFRCKAHPNEIVSMWRPDLQELLDEVLAGVDVSALLTV